MPTNFFQRVGDFFEQRKEFRAAALTALRKREGLPSPVDETGTPLETRFDDYGNVHYYDAAGNKVERVLWAGTGKEGKPGSFAIGTRKGEARELADARWGAADGGGFEILEISEDGRRIEDELHDLARDAAGFERVHPVDGPRVDLGAEGEQAPDLHLDGTSDEEVDQKLQEFLKRGPR
jgi:hypothetical protein